MLVVLARGAPARCNDGLDPISVHVVASLAAKRQGNPAVRLGKVTGLEGRPAREGALLVSPDALAYALQVCASQEWASSGGFTVFRDGALYRASSGQCTATGRTAPAAVLALWNVIAMLPNEPGKVRP